MATEKDRLAASVYGKNYENYKAEGGTANPYDYYNQGDSAHVKKPPPKSTTGEPAVVQQQANPVNDTGNIWNANDNITVDKSVSNYNTNVDEIAPAKIGDTYQGDAQGIFDAAAQDYSGLAPTTREVTKDELVSERLSGLLNSNSKYMQDARRQGLEQANAMGGLGGTAGIGASMTAALRAGLPIATEDARAFQVAASENMKALNDFTNLTMDRMTKIELGKMDVGARIDVTKMTNSLQSAVAQLDAITQTNIANLDAKTKLRVTEMNGQIQERLAALNFKYDAMLNDQNNAARLQEVDMQGQYNLQNTQVQGEYNLANTKVQGEFNLEQESIRQELQEETNYVNMVTGIQTNYWNMLSANDGVEMDDAARARAQQRADNYLESSMAFINSLFPDMDPIEVSRPGG